MHTPARQLLVQHGARLAARHIRIGQHQQAAWVPRCRCLQLLGQQRNWGRFGVWYKMSMRHM